MAKVKLEILSTNSDGKVEVMINGQRYMFFGMDFAVFKKRRETYKYKPGQLVNWLKKNSERCRRITPRRKVSPTNSRNHNAIMLQRTKNLIEASGYEVIMKGKTFDMAKCRGGCGRMSLIGAYSAVKEKVVGICMHRFNPIEEKRCTFSKEWKVAPRKDSDTKFTAKAVKGV